MHQVETPGDRDPTAGDRRAYRIKDADGKPIAVGLDHLGNVWIVSGDYRIRLERWMAIKVGGRLAGAGYRSHATVAPPGTYQDGPGTL